MKQKVRIVIIFVSVIFTTYVIYWKMKNVSCRDTFKLTMFQGEKVDINHKRDENIRILQFEHIQTFICPA